MAPPPSTGPSGSDMAGIGIYFAAAVLLPLLGGVALDRALNTAPVFVLVGLGVGLAAGATGIWLKVRELTK
jgi:F0F1-type ATP synthase assembly protein I